MFSLLCIWGLKKCYHLDSGEGREDPKQPALRMKRKKKKNEKKLISTVWVAKS